MYFVGVFFLDEEKPELPEVRCVGYYNEKTDAVKAVTMNACDIHEMTYNYAVIETIKEGLYEIDPNPSFFKYSPERDSYELCDKPEIINGYVGLCLG